ncbi:MAG: ribosome biogenesis GTPase Der [bacterium]
MNRLVAIVGRPNVGKSTLFNRLIGERRAILSDIPGTTRDVLFGELAWNRVKFTIADTAGIEFDAKSELAQDIMLQTDSAAKSADLIMLVVDAKTGINPEDIRAAQLIRKFNKPVMLLINKTDYRGTHSNASEFYRLGFKKSFEISGLTGKGVGDILDDVAKQLRKIKIGRPTRAEKETIRVAIVGRPNVGKSTLFNKLIKKKRSVVSSSAGTTRDAINEQIVYEGRLIEFIDTAGLRKRGKIELGIEKVSSLGVLRSVQQADVCLLITEASEGVIAQDLHVLQLILESDKSPILVLNKWDLVEKTPSITAEFEKYLDAEYNFAKWMPRVYISALTGQRVDKVFDSILAAWAARNRQIPAKDLNRLIATAVAARPPKGRRTSPKIYFSHQVATNPPKIEIKTNHPRDIHFSYLRYLENRIREQWDLTGTPLQFTLKASSTKKDI